jgi:hypothetical protein
MSLSLLRVTNEIRGSNPFANLVTPTYAYRAYDALSMTTRLLFGYHVRLPEHLYCRLTAIAKKRCNFNLPVPR